MKDCTVRNSGKENWGKGSNVSAEQPMGGEDSMFREMRMQSRKSHKEKKEVGSIQPIITCQRGDAGYSV